MARSKNLDPVHMLQHSYDEDVEAFKVKLADTEMAMELSADDGDSVLTFKPMLVIDAKMDELLDSAKYSKICIYEDEVILSLLKEDGMLLHKLTMIKGQVIDILSPKFSVNKDCTIVLKG
jgi:hypothetical protein